MTTSVSLAQRRAMGEPPDHEVTRLIERANAGDRVAARDLLPLVYGQLRNLANRKMAAE